MTDLDPMGQGFAVPASNEDIQRDELGYTNPNLHRRIDDEYVDEIKLGVFGVNSYKVVKHSSHDEESEESEIP